MASTEQTSSSIAWIPSSDYIQNSRLRQFMERHGIRDLDELQRRAGEDVAWFWDAAVKDLELEWYEPYQQVVDLSRGMKWAQWFRGGKFNYVHNALDKHAASEKSTKDAVIWEGEDGEVRKLTYGELYQEVNRLSEALLELGINKGDRIGIYMPMVPETVTAVLACSKIGAIFIPIFSGYAAPAAATRLRDCEAKLLITADGFYRRGSVVPMKATADAAVAEAPSVEHILVYKRIGQDISWTTGRDIWWHDAVAGKSGQVETERTDPEDPYMIIYTSGTTGKPKGAVHVHCGFPIKGAQDLAHCFDVKESDTLFWFTDIGWMMGPWAISGTLMLGATLFLYEGTPDFPRRTRLWEMAQRHKITVLGLSPTLIRALIPFGSEIVHQHDLSSLRILGSTGEPWNPEPWQWYFEHVGGKRCPIINYSGGTEISGGILGCTVLQPEKPCCFSGPVPGMAVDVVDEQGKSVRGAVGELVIRQPWVGMTRGFWRDPERYEQAYWSRFPDTWVHGDWALVDEDGYWFIQGRSDDTLKVAGKRVGPAEVESALVSHPAVQEAAAIGVPNEIKGEAVVGIVVLRPGTTESEDLRQELCRVVADQLGKALKPETVRFVDELPKTRNAKILRRVIRARYLGLSELGDLSSLENPKAVEGIGMSR